ncbi:hypothetical protein JCM10213_002689 [Rhodosporidiobolus nylandii]
MVQQGTLNAFVGRDVPKSDSLPDRLDFIKNRPWYGTKALDRPIYFSKDETNLYARDEVTKEPITYTMAGKAARAFLRKVVTGNGPPQYSLTLSNPVFDCDYEPGLEAIRDALQRALGDGVVDLNLRGGTDINCQRYYREFDQDAPDAKHFPNIYDFSKGGDINEAPLLEDLSSISSYSLVLVAFCVKVYDQRRLPASVQATLPQLQDDHVDPEEPAQVGDGDGTPATPPKKRSTVAAKKAKAEAANATSSADAPTKGQRAKVRRWGIRFEMSAIWWLGRDHGEVLKGSPTKAPRI